VWNLNASLVHMYWHGHHDFVDDMWMASASAHTLGLRELFGGKYTNITALGYTTRTAQAAILNRVLSAARKCAHAACNPHPSIRCTVNRDGRWERGVSGKNTPRYRPPRCHEWDIEEGHPYTFMSFHSFQPESSFDHTRLKDYWMHSSMYGYYTQLRQDPNIPVPHTAGETGLNNKPESEFDGWWWHDSSVAHSGK